MYELRTAEGIIVGQVSSFEAGKMMKNAGRWEVRSFTKVGKQNVFVFNGGFSYGNQSIQLFVWEGFYLKEV